MTLEQLIQIAQAGFPEDVVSHFNLDELRVCTSSNGKSHQLYHKDCPLINMCGNNIPMEYYMSVQFDDGFVQIDVVDTDVFNHYAAIKEVEKMGLI